MANTNTNGFTEKIPEYQRIITLCFNGYVKFEIPQPPPIPVTPVLEVQVETPTKKGSAGRKTPKVTNPTTATLKKSKKEESAPVVKKQQIQTVTQIEEPPIPPLVTYVFAFLFNGKLVRSDRIENQAFNITVNHEFTISDPNEIASYESKSLDIGLFKVNKIIDDPRAKKVDKKQRAPSAKKPTVANPTAQTKTTTLKTATEIPKDQQILQSIIAEEGTSEGVELLYSFAVDLRTFLFGSKRVSKRLFQDDLQNVYFSNLNVLLTLNEHLLSADALEW
ncbi:GTP cyclohydrolase [Acrasis kona]|uniref:GTP cyclohydrolase n=1 Tax=Acrasis kona TaxID=1008807 RepID=A0AAW2YN53_9EUKA